MAWQLSKFAPWLNLLAMSGQLMELILDIQAGEFLTLLGPSGSGKTTVLRMIAGFETPDARSILLNGKDITNLPAYERDVNTVFQDYALFPHMDVITNIEYGLKVKGVS